MKIQDLQVEATGDNCLIIKISKSVDLVGAKFKILGPSRNTIVIGDVSINEFEICTPTIEPTFVEIITKSGTVVRYVNKSGKSTYKC